MRPLKIYLGDLTHETITISSDTMPLNVGFLAAYLKKIYGGDLDIHLFKSPNELIQEIKEQMPDILGLSNYCWNFELSYFIHQYVKGRNQNILTVMGGANLPHLPEEQSFFLKQRSAIDFYVYQEGELSFRDLIGKFMNNGLDIAKTKREPIQGCLHISPETNALVNGGLPPRIKTLEELPSPYLSGVLDKFFSTRLNPFIQTNRGCPFTCSFCHEGDGYYTSVNYFSVDRIAQELDYISHHINGQTVLTIADSNFGMFRQDIEICKKIREIQNLKKYPRLINVTTGKNRPELILEAIQTLEKGTISMTASVQSLDGLVLENIKRKNIEYQTYIDIQRHLHAMDPKYSSTSEVILALPGETKESHFETIRKLIEAGVDRILIYTLMMLYGTEMSAQTEREKYQYVTKYRIIPRNFGEYEGHKCFEIEEVGVANKDLSFEDYQSCRKMSFVLTLVYNNKSFKELLKYLRERKVDIYPFVHYCFAHVDEADPRIRTVLDDFMRETKEELWNTSEDLRAYYNREENFAKLLQGEVAGNLGQKYWVKGIVFHFKPLVDFVFDCASKVLEANQEVALQLENLKTYTLLKRNRVFDISDASSEAIVDLDYDLESWFQDMSGRPLGEFASKKRFMVSTPSEQRQLLESLYRQYGTSIQAIGKVSTRVNIASLERQFTLVA